MKNNFKNDLFFCFVSCHKYKHRWDRIKKMCKDLKIENYNIFVGGDSYEKKGEIIQLECKDNYEDLPEKMFMIYNLISKTVVQRYNYFWKLDDDIQILSFECIERKKLFNSLQNSDYCGFEVIKYGGNREWHFDKCSTNSSWNTTPYTGNYPSWAEGGGSYLLSQKAINCFKGFKEYENLRQCHIYEDVAVAQHLLSFGIHPSEISPWSYEQVLKKDLYLTKT